MMLPLYISAIAAWSLGIDNKDHEHKKDINNNDAEY